MLPIVKTSPIAFAWMLWLGGGAVAQEKLLLVHGDDSYDRLGTETRRAGDVNGDGVPDFVAGAGGDETMGSAAGMARVYSGADGSVLYTFFGGAANDQFGDRVGGAGDVDGDGYDDVVVGSRYFALTDVTGNAQVFSGFDGSLLYTFAGDVDANFITSPVIGIGDVDADGHDDVLVGEPFCNAGGPYGGRVRVYSGLDGSILYAKTGAVGQQMGRTVGAAGDVNMDGVPDFITGGEGNANVATHVWVFSGADGAQLYHFFGPWSAYFGRAVGGAGDVNGDGHEDFVVGAPGDDSHGSSSGAAHVYSGSDGSLLYSFFGAGPGHQFGIDVGAGGDYDQDGFDDVLVGSVDDFGTFAGTSSARLYSGATGEVLRRFESGAPNDGFGPTGDVLGDVSGDGLLDYVFGAPSGDVHGESSGTVYVMSAAPLVSNYCTANVNSTGFASSIDSTGYTNLFENELVLYADHVLPGQAGLFINSRVQAQFPFGNGIRCVGSPAYRVFPILTADTNGVASHLFDTNANPWIYLIHAGDTWYFQYWYRDVPAGGSRFNLSDGLAATFIP